MARKNPFDDIVFTDKSYFLDDGSEVGGMGDGGSDTRTVPIDSLETFPGHPFIVDTDGDDFEELVESVKEDGLIYPILVRPIGDKYQIVSGHRRVAACRAAGISDVPAVVREMGDDEAAILMAHSNLYRMKISIKEKALAYRMCYDAQEHQRYQRKNGSESGDRQLSVSESPSGSRANTYRYIRLSHLNEELLDLVDGQKVNIGAGVELSYLPMEAQGFVLYAFNEYGVAPSIKQAEELRRQSESGEEMSRDKIVAMLLGDYKKKKMRGNVSFSAKKMAEYFEPGTGPDQMEETVWKLLEGYRSKRFVIDE